MPINRLMIRKAMWVVKLSVLLVGAFSPIALLVHFAVPWVLSRDFVVTTLPAVWTFARALLIPPYLFVTVNFIIIVIWVLPEKMHHQHHQSDDQPEHPIEITSPKPTDLEHLHATADTQSHNSSASPVAPAAAADTDETQVVEEEALSLDETWEMIKGGGGVSARKTLERSDPWEVAPPVEGSVVERGAETKQSETFSDCRQRMPVARKDVVVVGKDELNRKVEAFIKKMNDQIRLQQP